MNIKKNNDLKGVFAVKKEEIFKNLFDAVIEMNAQKGRRGCQATY